MALKPQPHLDTGLESKRNKMPRTCNFHFFLCWHAGLELFDLVVRYHCNNCQKDTLFVKRIWTGVCGFHGMPGRMLDLTAKQNRTDGNICTQRSEWPDVSRIWCPDVMFTGQKPEHKLKWTNNVTSFFCFFFVSSDPWKAGWCSSWNSLNFNDQGKRQKKSCLCIFLSVYSLRNNPAFEG